MSFESALEVVNGVAKITLSGELDASTASVFRADVERAAAAKVKAVALLVKDLEYLSSAGLRVLVFARQKLGSGTKIYVIGLQESVKEPIIQSGLGHSLILLVSTTRPR